MRRRKVRRSADVNARQIDAVCGCARTLGGAADADVAVRQSTATTLGPLRAGGDRAALRRRFLDERIEAAHRPRTPEAAALFDALSAARLDALGARWLAGVARNLLAYPGRDDDGVRWLAFECFAGRRGPAEKLLSIDAARSALSADLRVSLEALAPLLTHHEAFAAAAEAWSFRASGHAPAPQAAPSSSFDIPDRVGADVRQGRFALPARQMRPAQAPATADGQGGSGRRAPEDAVAALTGYRVFTTEFDRVVTAAALATREELTSLRSQLDADFSPMRSMVARLSKRLMRVLMARQAREWRFDLDDGLLDQARLPVFVASGGAVRPFKQEFESPFPSTVVTLLIDHSGSMKGRSMRIAALTVEIFARVLERCGVKCEILGFTTRDWDGGEPGRLWAEQGYAEHPGRLNALEHIVIKGADVPWRRARPALGLFLREAMLKENIDGEALLWAHRRLLARTEQRRILVVVSDGAPMDEATCAANGFDYLDAHLTAAVREIETRSPVKLAAIGIGHNVSQFYANATRISKIDELGPALTAKLLALLGD